MESHYVSQSGSRTLSKKTVLISAIALVAVVGAFCVFNAESTEFRFFRFKGPVEKAWAAWKVKHNKTYGGPEEKIRFNVFKNNHKLVQTHNAQKKNYTLGLNKFADLTNKEFASLHLGASVAFRNKSNGCDAPSFALWRGATPDTLDWRTQGRVGPVKDQGQCGSCWAFSTTGAIEGLSGKQGTLGSFSEQQLVDCSTSYGNFGCGGGWVQNAFHFVLANGGIAAEADYPYKAVDQSCQKVASAFKINDCANVATQSNDALKSALQNGPVSIYIEADQYGFQLYTGGVFDDTTCFSEGQIDHAVLAVGYDTQSWIVKNSWGTGWGKDGYIQISTVATSDNNGICGILSTPNTYPL